MSTIDLTLARALLFTPGNRSDRFAKAAATNADAIIIDLEDAISLAEKDATRTAVIDYLRANGRVPGRPNFATGVRVNNVHTQAGLRDLAAFAEAGVTPDFLVLPKVESAFEVKLYARILAAAQKSIRFICAIETARGAEAAFDIAKAGPRVVALAFGGLDFANDVRGDVAWEPLLAVRSRIAHAAASKSIGAIDMPFLPLNDPVGLDDECDRVRALGFTGKLVIHPSHVDGVIAGFSPSAAQIEEAQGILDAFERANGNACQYKGKMIDEPVFHAARRVLALAQR